MSGHESTSGLTSSHTGLAFGGNCSKQKVIFTTIMDPDVGMIYNNNGHNVAPLPTIHDDEGRVSKDALINAMEFMKQ